MVISEQQSERMPQWTETVLPVGNTMPGITTNPQNWVMHNKRYCSIGTSQSQQKKKKKKEFPGELLVLSFAMSGASIHKEHLHKQWPRREKQH